MFPGLKNSIMDGSSLSIGEKSVTTRPHPSVGASSIWSLESSGTIPVGRQPRLKQRRWPARPILMSIGGKSKVREIHLRTVSAILSTLPFPLSGPPTPVRRPGGAGVSLDGNGRVGAAMGRGAAVAAGLSQLATNIGCLGRPSPALPRELNFGADCTETPRTPRAPPRVARLIYFRHNLCRKCFCRLHALMPDGGLPRVSPALFIFWAIRPENVSVAGGVTSCDTFSGR